MNAKSNYIDNQLPTNTCPNRAVLEQQKQPQRQRSFAAAAGHSSLTSVVSSSSIFGPGGNCNASEAIVGMVADEWVVPS
jgi:hypothetical protein